MPNSIDRYETRTLLDMVTYQEPKPSMFRDSFFKGQDVYFPTKKAEWDEVREGAGMARYVSDRLEVDATEREGFITREIETPRFQEKRVLDLTSLTSRSAGETIYSQRTPADRARDQLLKDIEFCMDAIDRRVEQQCAQMMVSGRVDIVGRGIDTHVDYALPLKMTLSGSDAWGQSGAKPFDDLTAWANILRERNYNPTMLLMELGVAKVFLQDEKFREMLDNMRMDMGRIAPEQQTDIFKAAQFFGQIRWPGLGVLDLYTYSGTYKNDQGEKAPYLDPGRILMLSQEATQNRILYGAETIVPESEDGTRGEPITVEGRYVPQIFRDSRPPSQTIMVTSRAMPAPYQCDSWWTCKVF